MAYFVYMLRCGDGSYYTGYTTNIEERLKAHREGRGAKYTKGRTPIELVYQEKFEEKSGALRREWEIKHRFSKRQKEELIGS